MARVPLLLMCAVRVCNLVAAILLTASLAAGAQSNQTNSWAGSASGNWEDAHWSLGILPGTNQTILLTNAGWKALGIESGTAQNFPQTLSIAALDISSPANSFNSVLMNYSGLANPLLIGSDASHGILFVESNSAFTMLSSALKVNLQQATIFSPFDTPSAYGAFSVGGTFNESDGSQVTANFLKVGDIGPGVYNLTNSTLAVPYYEIIGGFPAVFNQHGGMNITAALVLTNSGEYNLFDGSLIFKNSGLSSNYDGQYDLQITFRGGNFNQWGGTVSAGLLYQSGTDGYHLAGGTLNVLNDLTGVSLLQTGGTNSVNSITLNGGGPNGPTGSYNLTDGVLNSSNVYVGAWQGVSPSQLLPYNFSQTGGSHISGTINVAGTYGQGFTLAEASYNLSGGSLSADAIYLSMGFLHQNGGTNHVVTLGLGNAASYYLDSGSLTAQTIQFSGGNFYGHIGRFVQSGGTSHISDLSLYTRASYLLSGGQMSAQTLLVTEGSTFSHTGGVFNLPGLLTLSEGNWDEQTPAQQFPQLQVDGGGASIISLSANASTLRFADSSARAWSTNAGLSIQNWQGSLFGGGRHQIIFGSNAAALTPLQLTLVSFYHPAGLPTGIYPARILPNGEIVPDAGTAVLGLTAGSARGSQLKLLGKAGKTYEIDVSTDLVNWLPWTNLVTDTGMLSITDTDATNHPVRFYRAVLQP